MIIEWAYPAAVIKKIKCALYNLDYALFRNIFMQLQYFCKGGYRIFAAGVKGRPHAAWLLSLIGHRAKVGLKSKRTYTHTLSIWGSLHPLLWPLLNLYMNARLITSHSKIPSYQQREEARIIALKRRCEREEKCDRLKEKVSIELGSKPQC